MLIVKSFPCFFRTSFLVILVLSFSSAAFANPVVATHFDKRLSQALSFTAFFLIETIVFVSAVKENWRFSAMAILLANLVTSLFGFIYASAVAELLFAGIGYDLSPHEQHLLWSDHIQGMHISILYSLLAHAACCFITSTIEFGVVAIYAVNKKKEDTRKYLFPVLYANLASYGALFFLVVLPTFLFFSYYY